MLRDFCGTRPPLSRPLFELRRRQALVPRTAVGLELPRGGGHFRDAGAQLRRVKRVDHATRLAAERTRTTTSLTALLERATQLLAAAERSNREMHAYGLQLINEVRGRAGSDAAAAVDPVLGLRQVRIENRAEELRDGLDALKLPAQARP